MESVNGWTPPVIFDFGTGETRIATQADMDAGMNARRILSEVREHLRQVNRLVEDVLKVSL